MHHIPALEGRPVFSHLSDSTAPGPRVNIVLEVDQGILYLAVKMPDKSLCKPECPVTVSVLQDADGATLVPSWLALAACRRLVPCPRAPFTVILVSEW